MEQSLKRVFNSEIREIDVAKKQIKAIISTGSMDRYREVVDPNGMDKKNFDKNPVVLWAHNYEIPPIGKSMWIRKEGNGLVARIQFADTEKANEIFGLYKDGFMKAFSIGFIPKTTEYPEVKDDDRIGDRKKKPRAIYKEWELLEFSAVPVPANPEALSLCIKKGLIKTEDAPAILERGFDPDKWNEEPIEKELKEVGGDVLGEEIKGIEMTEPGLEALLDEVESLEMEKAGLLEKLEERNKEIISLNLALYNMNKKIEKLQENPGITASELGTKIVEVASGVIRKHLGAV